MNPTLCQRLFRALDGLCPEMHAHRSYLRRVLENKVLSTEASVSPQAQEYIEMLLDEYCEGRNACAPHAS